MQDDHRNKFSIDKDNRITKRTSPNDDEEILNNKEDKKYTAIADDKIEEKIKEENPRVGNHRNSLEEFMSRRIIYS